MSGAPEWMRRRTTLRRGLGLSGIVAVMVVTVEARAATQPPARMAENGLHVKAVSTGAPAPSAAPPHPRTSHSAQATHQPAAPHQTRAAAPAKPTSPPAPVRRTVTGAAYDVGYGIVQVQVTLVGSKLVDVTALSLPQGGRSSDISAMAGPQLRDEALQAQSAHIDAVSGASYTSAGYQQSLQSALDKAHA